MKQHPQVFNFFAFHKYKAKILFVLFYTPNMHLSGASQKNLPANARNVRDVGLIPRSGRSPGGGNGNPTLVFLPGESHGQEGPDGLQSTGSQRVRQSKATEHACTLMLTGFPRWLSGKESACQCGSHRRCEFDPWIGKIPWRRTWQPTPVFLLGEYHGSLVGSWGYKKSDMT